MSRVPAPMRKILSHGDAFFDVHCHVFNYRDVPDKFLGIRIPQNERLLSYLEKILHRLVNSTDTDKYSNLAYFGGDAAWEKYSSGESENWASRIIDMMYRFDGLLADFSYTFYQQKYSKALKKLLSENDEIASRVLYGSDFYMVVSEGHFRSLKISFTTTMGDELMKKIAKENPMRFLFG